MKEILMGTQPCVDPVKARMKAAWMAGDYGIAAQHFEPGALELFANWRIPPSSRMLDVACGAGQIAIPAARSGINVVGIDIATNLIEQARARAKAEGLAVQFDEGDAEQLPYPTARSTQSSVFGRNACTASRPCGDGAFTCLSFRWTNRHGQLDSLWIMGADDESVRQVYATATRHSAVYFVG